eukprot:TRINITY_DN29294_c0_g1_i1.p1 TRINITY_DN29294_c0_g1~~TRINITY_DN29294_c0_g1_i1.p1  ORF type:complete len:103 (-),score=1.79 TRINITY_DN29294_c0_g1_i1:1567-1875(-)
MFLHLTPTGITILFVYIYDIIVTRTDASMIRHLEASLHDHFHMKDLGLLTLFSGLQVVQFAKGIFINQHKYTTDLTHIIRFHNSTPVEVPILAWISPMQLIC